MKDTLDLLENTMRQDKRNDARDLHASLERGITCLTVLRQNNIKKASPKLQHPSR